MVGLAEKKVGRVETMIVLNNKLSFGSKVFRRKAKRQRTRVNLLKRSKPSKKVKHSVLIVCEEPYSESDPGETWMQCVYCKLWAHECCVSHSLRITFRCQHCK